MKPTLFVAICIWIGLGSPPLLTPLSGEVPTPPLQTPPPKPDPAEGGGPELQLITMLRHAVPGESHLLLNRLVGDWTTRTRYWMKPGTEPVEATGSSTRRWILDGRFVLEDLDGGDLGLPFRALGLFGYDAFERRYTSAWLDTTSTAILTYLGSYDATNSVVTFEGQYKDPWTGTRKKLRGLTRFLAQDRLTLELHVTEPAGTEFRMLEITYARKAAAPPPAGAQP